MSSLIVSGFTPESSSVTVKVIVGWLLVSNCDAVGAEIVITGAVFSLTVSLSLLPRVASD